MPSSVWLKTLADPSDRFTGIMFSQEQAAVSRYFFRLPGEFFCVFWHLSRGTLVISLAGSSVNAVSCQQRAWGTRQKRGVAPRPETKVGDVVDASPVIHPGNNFL
jgi:hypothetical protein